ncbi:DNA mismatch repair protein Msh3 [Caerostris extrusa]|uniref:DNA mismatch repair protein Msh3 n=1 Tax=Caerostris extrusa TaxID=172846 RepID=A0AAV4WLS2_CAEEX|nr:DNA mismatch repair protein Msh3 [Caerostris extrusa]
MEVYSGYSTELLKFGERLLKLWIAKPLRNINLIEERLNIVELKLSILNLLFLSLADLVSVADKVSSEILVPRNKIILTELPELLDNVEKYLSNIDHKAAREGDKTKIFLDISIYPAMKKCQDEILDAEKKLNDLRSEICKILKMIHFKYATVAGQKYLIEVPNSHMCLVPNNWLKISLMAHRFRKPSFQIQQGQHPMIAKFLGEGNQFVANDVQMNKQNMCMIVTGPNMGGKSTYVRQIALIAIMSHIGSYVPAELASIPLFDNIYVRMGSEDALAQGKSTFMVEMSETSEILANITSKSLVILDELGRGTSTNDGTAIAYATLEYLVSDISCFTLFVTHYPPVVELVSVY